MTEYFSLNIQDEKHRHKYRIYIRPEEGKKLYPKLVINNDLNILPCLNDDITDWVNEHVKQPFYMTAIGDLGIDGVTDNNTNRIIFTDPNDYMYFKLKWV